jgi:hypothetical protein
MFTIIHRTVRPFIPVEACMETGQHAREHSSGSEISNWTNIPGEVAEFSSGRNSIAAGLKKNTKCKIYLGELARS